MSEYSNQGSFLMTPGPVTLSDTVRKALSNEIIFHRYSSFESLFEDTCNLLHTILDTTPEHQVLILTGTGTLANESAISSVFNENDRLLMLSNGDFGERLITMASMHGIPHKSLRYEWGEEIDCRQVEHLLCSEKFTGIVMVGLETSTGMSNPVEEIGLLSEKYRLIYFLDAVSAIGSEYISVKDDNIDVCITVPNKGIGGPPGLGVVALSPAAVRNAERNKGRSMYLDLNRYLDFARKRQTPTTPAVSLFYGLKAALTELKEETVDRRILRYQENTAFILDRLQQFGVTPFVKNSSARSNAGLTLSFPDYIDIVDMHNHFIKNGITLWKPLHPGPLKPYNCMQLSVMGAVRKSQIMKFLDLFEDYVKTLVPEVKA